MTAWVLPERHCLVQRRTLTPREQPRSRITVEAWFLWLRPRPSHGLLLAFPLLCQLCFLSVTGCQDCSKQTHQNAKAPTPPPRSNQAGCLCARSKPGHTQTCAGAPATSSVASPIAPLWKVLHRDFVPRLKSPDWQTGLGPKVNCPFNNEQKLWHACYLCIPEESLSQLLQRSPRTSRSQPRSH